MKIKSMINRILLIIIILFLGFVFWLGWEQLQLEENTYGVVYTKTSGWKDSIIESGKFNWSVEKIRPLNYTIHKFTINNQPIGFKVNKTLPSGDLYASYNKIEKSNFSYNFSVVGTIIFNTSSLTEQLKRGNINQDNFSSWEQSIVTEVKEALESYIEKNMFSDESIATSAKEYISSIYPYYIFNNLYINVNSPDLDLYEASKRRYLTYIKQKEIAEENYLIDIMEQENRESLKIELLSQYGDVFTKYPILLEYFKINKETTFNKDIMENLIPTLNQK